MNPFLIYLLAVNVFSIIICCYDKYASRSRRRRRVSEKVLLLLSAFGGAVMMYFTMCIIRHKTRHNKFMVGLPIIMLIQATLIFVAYYNIF